MRLVEEYVQHEFVNKYVEKYQLYDLSTPSYLKTIPNAKLECWLIIKGGFEIFDTVKNRFVKAKKIGGYPATNQSLLFHIPHRLYVLNIKFKLNALSILPFRQMYSPRLDFDASTLFLEKGINDFHQLEFDQGNKLDVPQLDHWLLSILQNLEKDPQLEKLFTAIETANIWKVEALARYLNMSIKTLERLTIKHFQLRPKQFLNILRFDKAAHFIKNQPIPQFIDALSFGFYDQSHFIRICKQITGLSPKDFFAQLELSTHDLMVQIKRNQSKERHPN